ncbi:MULTISPECIES: protein sorting system archaetidylserine decarboxylase [Halolamina]|uniref:Phosphatidylserine decarboxylase n=1 Tax=Halolamina pelagica TaxID=699431 RepID=A0A1I5PNI9_9EURY|nr:MULTISPECIES: protein sorting system archaetidylserine decarboxylase [Halolamina]NHX34887.1 phosphatidylserine decarboxylase [Halolamina sp. R1-12]SFP35350.1 phosphatidylserine decarboxylase [Halolamina pelagica]
MVRGLTPGALRYGLPPLLAGVVLTPVSGPIGLGLVALGLAAVLFHRDPQREPPESGFVAPADGSVSVVREEEGRIRVGVFMNVTDVHVNRAPAAGTVESVTHRPGANKPAFSKDSDRNERVDVDCGEYEVSLIAGWFARRIHPYVEGGDDLDRGDKLGHISFGSRADVLLPERVEHADLRVNEGEDVTAGETVVAVDPDE